jgi:hypothetical protein
LESIRLYFFCVGHGVEVRLIVVEKHRIDSKDGLEFVGEWLIIPVDGGLLLLLNIIRSQEYVAC